MNISELDMSDEGKTSRMMDYALDEIHKKALEDGDKQNINGIVYDVVRELGLDSMGIDVRDLAQKYLEELRAGRFAMEDKENNEPEILDPEAAENSDPNKLFNLGLSETDGLEEALEQHYNESGMSVGAEFMDDLDWDFSNLPRMDWDAYEDKELEQIEDYLYHLDFDDQSNDTYDGMFARAGKYVERIRKKRSMNEDGIVRQSHPAVVLDRVADRSDNNPFPVKFYDGSVLKVTPKQARGFMDVYYKMDDAERKRADAYLKTKNGFLQAINDFKISERIQDTFPQLQEVDDMTLTMLKKLGEHMSGDQLKSSIQTVLKSRGYDSIIGK